MGRLVVSKSVGNICGTDGSGTLANIVPRRPQFATTGIGHEGPRCQLSPSRSATAITPHRHADRVCVRPARMVYTSGPRGEGTGLARRITLQSSELERSRSETAPALARRSGTWRNIIHKKPFAKYGQTKSPSPVFPTRAARGIVNGHSEPSIGPQPDGDARVWYSQSLPSSDTNPATSDMRGTWTHRAMTKDDNYEQAFR